MSEPCPLCGREKLKDRVQRPPPMTESPDTYCLHPSHIYEQPIPPCERIGIERLQAICDLASARLANLAKVVSGVDMKNLEHDLREIVRITGKTWR